MSGTDAIGSPPVVCCTSNLMMSSGHKHSPAPSGCLINLFRVSFRYRYIAVSITIAWLYLTPQTVM